MKLQSKSANIYVYVHTFFKCMSYNKLNTFVLVSGLLLMAIGLVWQTNAEKLLFDGSLLFIQGSNQYKVINNFISFILSYAFTQIMIHIANCAEEILTFRLQKRMMHILSNKVSFVKAIKYEDSNFLQLLEKAKKGREGIVYASFSCISLIFYYIPYFICISIWLIKQNVILFFAVPIAFIPAVVIYMSQIKSFSDMENDTVELNRKLQACENGVIGNQQIKETRILGCNSFFISRYKELACLISKRELKTWKQNDYKNFWMKTVQSFSFVLIMFIAIISVVNGSITVGTFAAIFSSIDTLFSNMNEAVSRQFGTISENLGTARDFINFIDMKFDGIHNSKKSVSLQLDHVYFSYPNSNRNVLKNISLSIRSGEKIAIVGENGAGKSTLVKILLGIYEPTSGRKICSNNADECGTAVFQNQVNYAMTLKDNICISSRTDNEEQISHSIINSGIDLNNRSFINGISTFLAKEFGGVDLSGGQWKRVAIARGIYKYYSCIFYDEPTSTIDPLEETKIYKNIRDMSRDKTAIIVTHRMASVSFVDRVIVMKDGEIIEEGTHDELLKKNGEYTKMYLSQSENYT